MCCLWSIPTHLQQPLKQGTGESLVELAELAGWGLMDFEVVVHTCP